MKVLLRAPNMTKTWHIDSNLYQTVINDNWTIFFYAKAHQTISWLCPVSLSFSLVLSFRWGYAPAHRHIVLWAAHLPSSPFPRLVWGLNCSWCAHRTWLSGKVSAMWLKSPAHGWATLTVNNLNLHFSGRHSFITISEQKVRNMSAWESLSNVNQTKLFPSFAILNLIY